MPLYTMKLLRWTFGAWAICLVVGTPIGATEASTDDVQPDATTHEITIRAGRFSFEPDEITVGQGDMIRLTLEALDVPHGLALPDFGLTIVSRPDEEPGTAQFQADTAGAFTFTCAVFCGSGHGEMRGVLTVLPRPGQDQRHEPDRTRDRVVDVIEPAFTLATLPTTLRLPHKSVSFRLTHRFSRPVGGGPGYGNFVEDFFGLDSGALIGLELRYGLGPDAQVGVYRQSNRNIQIFGKYNVLWQGGTHGVGLDAYASVEGANNFRQDYAPALGGVLSKRFGERAAIYVEPVWVRNVRTLLPPEAGVSSDDDHALLLGLATRVRVLDTVYAIAEYAPRVTGISNGDDHISVGIEKRAGGHVFQLNLSNGLGSTPAQLAGGGDDSDWFLGFNIMRKFY